MELQTRRFLHDIIAELLELEGKKVVWVNQDGVRQTSPLVTLMTYSHRGEAMEDHVGTDSDGIMTIKTPTAFVLEVRYFGEKKSYPVDILDNLIRHLEKPTIVDKCFTNGVAFLYATPVQDITTTLENNQQYEPAAAVDIHCRYTNSITDDVGLIEEVEIHGEEDPEPGEEGKNQLIYGHIDADGTVTDLDHAIPVDITIDTKE